MKPFRKDADYAVRALLFLAMQDGDEFISTFVIAGELGIPLNFLRRICSRLIQAEILETKEGACGGVRLIRKPDTINIRELTELFQGAWEISECTFRKELCVNRSNCVLRRRLLAVEESMLRQFEAITIQTLLDDLHQNRRTSAVPTRKEPRP